MIYIHIYIYIIINKRSRRRNNNNKCIYIYIYIYITSSYWSLAFLVGVYRFLPYISTHRLQREEKCGAQAANALWNLRHRLECPSASPRLWLRRADIEQRCAPQAALANSLSMCLTCEPQAAQLLMQARTRLWGRLNRSKDSLGEAQRIHQTILQSSHPLPSETLRLRRDFFGTIKKGASSVYAVSLPHCQTAFSSCWGLPAWHVERTFRWPKNRFEQVWVRCEPTEASLCLLPRPPCVQSPHISCTSNALAGRFLVAGIRSPLHVASTGHWPIWHLFGLSS